MFTLKLYRRQPHGAMQQKIVCIDHAQTIQIGPEAFELWAFKNVGDYDTYYIGNPEKGMDAFDRDDLHLDSGPNSWWGWGLLENWEGHTSQHFRPASFG